MRRLLPALCAAMLTVPCMACNTLYFDPPTALSDTDNMQYVTYNVGGDVDLGLGASDFDLLAFQFFTFSHPFTGGTFDLGSGDDANYVTCNECVLLYQDKDSPMEKIFYQSAGLLTIDAATPPLSDPISMRWTGLHLVEVTIDPTTFESTPVPGGACFDVLMQTVFRNGFEA